jgi:hypothetical protein
LQSGAGGDMHCRREGLRLGLGLGLRLRIIQRWYAEKRLNERRAVDGWILGEGIRRAGWIMG